MEQFIEIFTLPDSPNPEYNPRENVLNWIRVMDEALEAERRQAHTSHFLNQLNDAETGYVSIIHEDQDAQGAVGGQGPPPPPPQMRPDPAVHIVNEYNSFNLATLCLL